MRVARSIQAAGRRGLAGGVRRPRSVCVERTGRARSLRWLEPKGALPLARSALARAAAVGPAFATAPRMSRPIPKIKQYMAPMPHTVGEDQPLAVAHRMMREHKIRHLPVLSGGRLAGILTERDMALVETMKGVDPAKVPTGEAMSQLVYAVTPDTPLDEVAAEMAEHKYGCAVVMTAQKVVGVFTTVDGMRALHDLLLPERRRHVS